MLVLYIAGGYMHTKKDSCCCSVPQLNTVGITQHVHPDPHMYKYRCHPDMTFAVGCLGIKK